MNSSEQPFRRIASNLLWRPEGVLRNPLVSFAADGEVQSITQCDDPDRIAQTEFYAGLLVLHFPQDFRAAFEALDPRTPLPEQLARIVRPTDGVPVVLSGLDYPTLRLTGQSQILCLGWVSNS